MCKYWLFGAQPYVNVQTYKISTSAHSQTANSIGTSVRFLAEQSIVFEAVLHEQLLGHSQKPLLYDKSSTSGAAFRQQLRHSKQINAKNSCKELIFSFVILSQLFVIW